MSAGPKLANGLAGRGTGVEAGEQPGAAVSVPGNERRRPGACHSRTVSVSLAVTAADASRVPRVNLHTAVARELLDSLLLLTRAGAAPRLDERGIFRADVPPDAPWRLSVAAETLSGREVALVRLHGRHLARADRSPEAPVSEAERGKRRIARKPRTSHRRKPAPASSAAEVPA